MLAHTPAPPYVAVIFTSKRTSADDGYDETAERMYALVQQQPGFISVDSVRGADGVSITVSYFTDEAAVAAWKQQADHLDAQRAGRERWYEAYEVRVAKVERAWSFPR